MKKIFIESINKLIVFDKTIVSLKFDSPINYRNISFNVLNNLTYSEDNNIIDLNKYSLIIYNPFQIELNERKLVNAMYKTLEKTLTNDDNMLLNEIERISFTIFDNLLQNTDFSFEYDININTQSLFQAFNISFPKVEYNNYLELISTYFKLYSKFNKTKIIISFGLLSLLEKEEIVALEKELDYDNLVLIDISYNGNNKINEKDLYIDEDWCII